MNIDGNPAAGPDEDIQIDLDPADLDKTPEGAGQTQAKSAEEGIEDFKRQLEEERAQRAKEEADRRAAELARQRAEQEAAQWRNAATTGQQQAAEAALHNAQQATASAKAKLKAAFEAGDYDAAADAQEEIAKNAYRAEQIQRELEAAKNRPAPRVESRQADPLAGYAPRTREWLRAHPDVLSNPGKLARAQAAHYEAVDAGLEPESDAYFAFAEERLGYRKAEQAPLKRESSVAAPPSRGDGGSQRSVSPNSVRLSAAEVKWAEEAGFDLKEYGRNKRIAEARAKAAQGH